MIDIFTSVLIFPFLMLDWVSSALLIFKDGGGLGVIACLITFVILFVITTRYLNTVLGCLFFGVLFWILALVSTGLVYVATMFFGNNWGTIASMLFIYGFFIIWFIWSKPLPKDYYWGSSSLSKKEEITNRLSNEDLIKIAAIAWVTRK